MADVIPFPTNHAFVAGAFAKVADAQPVERNIDEVCRGYAQRLPGETDGMFARRVLAQAVELTQGELLYLIAVLDEMNGKGGA